MEFWDLWLWLILMVVGLLLAMVELIIGVDAGLDLVFVGSSFILGGLVTWPFHSWALTAIVAGLICIAYVAIGRKYVHRWTMAKKEKTNVDAIIGRRGVVLRDIGRTANGLVRVGNEEWRAIADEEIKEGTEVEVLEVKGVTLTVKSSRR
ncbi:MAG: NfeD family protein [Chloroflexi bacterium]|nr:NfeD family protein [Chloroflexota bacterium]